jgi:hypothetical protein
VVEQCSGRRGDLASIRWYSAPASVALRDDAGRRVDGLWISARRAIVLQEGLERDARLVRHEMLHALLGDARHPRDMFVRRCGGALSCGEGCLDEAGPPPAPDPLAVGVPPESLRITVEAVPAVIASGPAGGHVFIVITATNPSARPVVAELPPSGDAGPPLTFGYWISGGGGSMQGSVRATTPESVRFAPGESKRGYFDLWTSPVPREAVLWPGEFVVRGGYGERWAERDAVLDVR